MSIRKRSLVTCAAALSIIAGAACQGASAQTLKAVKDRGEVICGVSHGLPGFAAPDASGAWSGIDVDYCRAVAAAIFHDPGKVRFTPLAVDERFDALKSGKIDVLAQNSTWTMSPEIASALELDGAKVCVQSGTTTLDNFEDYFKSNNLKYEEVLEPSQVEALKDYEVGKCAVLTSDISQLYALRLQLANPR